MYTFTTVLAACENFIQGHDFTSVTYHGNLNKKVRLSEDCTLTEQPELPLLKKGDEITIFRSPERARKYETVAFIERGDCNYIVYGSGEIVLRVVKDRQSAQVRRVTSFGGMKVG